jgi:hypothetical protein
MALAVQTAGNNNFPYLSITQLIYTHQIMLSHQITLDMSICSQVQAAIA